MVHNKIPTGFSNALSYYQHLRQRWGYVRLGVKNSLYRGRNLTWQPRGSAASFSALGELDETVSPRDKRLSVIDAGEDDRVLVIVWPPGMTSLVILQPECSELTNLKLASNLT